VVHNAHVTHTRVRWFEVLRLLTDAGNPAGQKNAFAELHALTARCLGPSAWRTLARDERESLVGECVVRFVELYREQRLTEATFPGLVKTHATRRYSEQEIALLVVDPDQVDDEALWQACREDPEAGRRAHELGRLRFLLESERSDAPSPDPPADLRARHRTDPMGLPVDQRARLELHLSTAPEPDEGLVAAERFDFRRIEPREPRGRWLGAMASTLFGAPLRQALAGALCFALGVLSVGQLERVRSLLDSAPPVLAAASRPSVPQELVELRERVQELELRQEDAALGHAPAAQPASEPGEWAAVTMGVAPREPSELTASGIAYEPDGLFATVRQSLFQHDLPAGSELLIENPRTQASVRVTVVDSHADEVARESRDPVLTPRINLSPGAMRALGYSELANRPLRYRVLRVGGEGATA